MIKSCFVTGGTSPIGGFIVDMLLAQGKRVRIISRQPVASWHPALEVIQGDLRDRSILSHCMRGMSALFHCAAEFYNQETLWDINVRVTEELMGLVCRESLEYVCYIGSAGVLGGYSAEWVDESTPCCPRSLYEKSKLVAEQCVLSKRVEAQVCVLRPVFVVSRERPGFLVYPIRNAWMDKLMIAFKGKEQAHLVHAYDVAAAAVYFSEVQLDRPECFYVACDEEPLNTVRGLYTYYRYACENDDDRCMPTTLQPLSLPQVVPYVVRRVRRGSCLHGRVKFSSVKIRDFGFTFPLGFRGAVRDIISDRVRR